MMPGRAFDSGFGPGFGSPFNKGQLALIVGTHPTYEDGDIAVAKNYREIRHVHAQHICWPRINGIKVGGHLGSTQPLLEMYFQQVQQYRWDRVNAAQVKRTNQWTGSEIVYGDTPVEDPDRPGRMIHCDIQEWVELRAAAGKHPLFGPEGAERFYLGDGRTDASHARLDAVWTAIESMTPNREIDFPNWPFSAREMQIALVIDTDDFDDAEAGVLTSPLVDNIDPDNPVMLKKRQHRINWRALRDVIEADVLNQNLAVDIRGRKHIRNVIVEAK